MWIYDEICVDLGKLTCDLVTVDNMVIYPVASISLLAQIEGIKYISVK